MGPGQARKGSGVTDGGSWGGITLAHNVGSPEEVDLVIEEAREAGARIGREPAETFYGGYTGVLSTWTAFLGKSLRLDDAAFSCNRLGHPGDGAGTAGSATSDAAAPQTLFRCSCV